MEGDARLGCQVTVSAGVTNWGWFIRIYGHTSQSRFRVLRLITIRFSSARGLRHRSWGGRVCEHQSGLEDTLARSEEYEQSLYFEKSKELYAENVQRTKALFTICARLTNGFRDINGDAIVSDSRIVKILRYCMAPSISQMKMGQSVGMNSTDAFEDERVVNAPRKRAAYQKLCNAAPLIAETVRDRLDEQRFPWLHRDMSSLDYRIALDFACDWTCSLISSENAETEYRTIRKETQEGICSDQIRRAGYEFVEYGSDYSGMGSLLPGQYCDERRVIGHGNHKADFILKLKRSGKLMLIEAKAIGVRVDSHKRMKEVNTKFTAWRQIYGEQAIYAAFLSGFFKPSLISDLIDEGVLVFWEHSNELHEYLLNE